MRNAFAPPLNVPHNLSVSTETRDNLLNHEADYSLPIYNPQHKHSYSEKKDGYSGKILDQSKAETQPGKRLVSGTLRGLDGSALLALLPAPLSLRLDSLQACSSPGQMWRSSGIFYYLGISTAT